MSNPVASKDLGSGRTLTVWHGNLVHEQVDAIVNAANTELQHGGGVALAIVRAGGRIVQEESNAIGHVSTGSAAMTGSGSLPARFVIHAVGPIWHGGGRDEDRLLHGSVTAALSLAHEKGLSSIAFPAISTGIYGYPKKEGARVILQAIEEFVDTHDATSLTDIRLILIDAPSVAIFKEALQAPSPRKAK